MAPPTVNVSRDDRLALADEYADLQADVGRIGLQPTPADWQRVIRRVTIFGHALAEVGVTSAS